MPPREEIPKKKRRNYQNDPTMQTAYASMPVKPRDVTGDTEQEEEMPVQKEKEALEEDKEEKRRDILQASDQDVGEGA